MKIALDDIIGDVVAKNYKTAEIFGKHSIDLCVDNQISVRKAGEKKKLSTAELQILLYDLNMLFVENEAITNADFSDWDLDLLVDHIVNHHHSYVEEKIPVVRSYLDRIQLVHGRNHPELNEIKEIFKEASGELAMHLKKEELILFPYIKKMAKAKRENSKLESPHFGTIKNPIAKMEGEHDFEDLAFKKIAELSDDYTLPSDACNSYRVAFGLLEEFEEDLHTHIHKENDILFQRAIVLEEELLERGL